MAANATPSAAVELLAMARSLERLALRSARRGLDDEVVVATRVAARRLRVLALEWDDTDDLDAWYCGLGARALCANARRCGVDDGRLATRLAA